jgi:hypothetical protein
VVFNLYNSSLQKRQEFWAHIVFWKVCPSSSGGVILNNVILGRGANMKRRREEWGNVKENTKIGKI